jgi:hypothetical protein
METVMSVTLNKTNQKFISSVYAADGEATTVPANADDTRATTQPKPEVLNSVAG